MKILIKHPTRERPDLFFKTLDLYYNLLSYKYDYEFVITCDINDASMNNSSVIEKLKSKNNLSYHFGCCKSKIEAINSDLEGKSFDILILAADDMIPKIKNYDDIIIQDIQKHFPDMDGVLHYNDGRVGKVLNTLPILTKKYYDRFGYIYHPDYVSLFCDNEFEIISKTLKRVVFIDKTIIHHQWVDYTGKDRLHERNESFSPIDQKTFGIRTKLGFPKESVK